MNIDWLRTFVEVVERGSFTQAGEVLHLSQPAVSQHVRKLEQYFDTELRDPMSREVRWTPAAERVYQMALGVLKEIDAARTELALHHAPGQVVTVASGPAVLFNYLPRVLARFWRDHPHVRVQTRTVVDQSTLPLLVRKGEADLALHADVYRIDSLPSVPCALSVIVPVCSPDHPLAGKAEVQASEVGPLRVALMPKGSGIRSLVDNWFAERGVVLTDVLELATFGETKAMAMDAGMVGFVGESIVKQDISLGRLQVLPIAGFNVSRWVYVSHAPVPTESARTLLRYLCAESA